MPRLQLLLFIIFIILWNNSINSHDVNYSFDILKPHYDISKIRVLKRMHNPRCHFTFIRDASKNLFIIKQVNQSSPTMQLKIIREMLGAYIAESSNLRANRVEIIPGKYFIPGKSCKKPATLHTIVPGHPVSQLPNTAKLDIKQPIKERSIIYNMSLHPDLPVIVAFDTFIGNHDRSRNNFFYDRTSNTFWMIDMEKSFTRNLCDIACNAIHKFLKNQLCKFTHTQIKGLVIYRNTLKKLIKEHPPHALHKKLDDFVSQAGIKPGSHNKVAATIQKYKKTISESYTSAQQLVTLLDTLINQYKIGKRGYNYDYEQFNIAVMQQELCSCCIDQCMMYNTDLLCWEEQLDYTVDRLHAYSHAFST